MQSHAPWVLDVEPRKSRKSHATGAQWEATEKTCAKVLSGAPEKKCRKEGICGTAGCEKSTPHHVKDRALL